MMMDGVEDPSDESGILTRIKIQMLEAASGSGEIKQTSEDGERSGLILNQQLIRPTESSAYQLTA
jgi:hypothetical protein